MNDLRLVLRHIGGTSAVSWQAFIVSSVLSVFTYLGGSHPPSDEPLTWLTILAIAQVLGFVPLVVAKKHFGPTLSTQPRPLLMLTLFALVAVIRGIVLDTGLLWSGAEMSSWALFRVFAAMPTIMVALSATAVIVGSAREHRTRLTELLAVNHSLEQARDRAQHAVSDEQGRALERITAQLQDELDELDPNRPLESAEALHHLAADIVRPLSHELANAVPTWKPREVPIEVPKVSSWRVISRVPAGQPFMPITTAIALVSAAMGTAVMLLGLQEAVTSLAVGIPIAIGLLATFNAAMATIRPTWPSWIRPATFAVFTVLAGAAAAMFTATVMPAGPDADRLVPSSFRYTIVTVLLLAAMKAYWTVRADVLTSLERRGEQLRWSVARARQVQWFQQRALSRMLHGPAQSALNAAAMRIDAAREENQPLASVVAAAKSELEEVFERMSEEGHRASSLHDTVEQLASVWSGLCDVRCEISPEADKSLRRDPISRTMVAEIITEGVSNAIRHGAARNISIDVAQRTERLIQLTITNDGAPPSGEGGTGLGSRLLDECAIEWHRKHQGKGTLLEACMPTAAEASASP